MDVKESRKIHVLKRDGAVEPFDRDKLTAALWRAMAGTAGTYRHARLLVEAVELFLLRNERDFISSAAVFEMAAKVLRRVHLRAAAKTLEAHRTKRAAWRRTACVIHSASRATQWDKAWVAQIACRSWHLMDRTGRIIAARIENDLRRSRCDTVDRDEIVQRVNRCVAQMGLADAVPVNA